jgi:hypothetical protein
MATLVRQDIAAEEPIPLDDVFPSSTS